MLGRSWRTNSFYR